MALVQNISSVNLANNSTTQQYFNNIAINIGSVGNNVNDAIVGYFTDQTNGNTQAAQALASAVIYTSLAQGVDPMQTLQEFIKIPKGELNIFLATFLNLNRIGTSYLGTSNRPLVNKYVQRAILA